MKSLIDRMKQDQERKSGSKYVQLKDKEQVRLRILQELDPKAPGYDEKAGLAFYTQVHSNPKNFKRQAACTADTEGRCWACEQLDKPGKEQWKWKPKGRLYVNVLVKTPEGTKVQVLQQGMSDKHVANQMLDFADEYGSITDRDYKFKRTGADMNNTSYNLTPLEQSHLDLTDLELIDLTKLVRNVAYADQEAFYLAEDDDEGPFDGNSDSSSSGSSGW